MSSSNILIEVRDLQYTYPGQSQPTLKIPEFSVLRGEELFLYGPSGTGKTTLLELFSGVLKPTQGSLKILGFDFGKMTDADRDAFRAEHMGYVFQNFNLIPYLSVQENIELPLHLSPARKARLGSVDTEMVIRALCGNLGIGDLLGKKVSQLSVGQQQRVAVARALLGKPDLILADEPTSALDTDHREKFLKLMFELADLYGTTVVFVSHDRTMEKLFSRSISLDSINRVG
ncbi:MAG: methionine ABC transporter ATP-binding protein [Bdellovibrio sp. ArHS]|uniref:ABC transporter ATP-binding protein n=1 Tax=Bdellovibrio sp. ArHS TaxID=1569284 RepID=UPI0005828554|nr:ABC transporter ATP-binding protein [Bdellovibrio sp. ArHS]KHD89425.1 MAG: methionine ABC transporter ATP-binding protein [Bdellovibrio sp. ArHS]